MARWTYDNRHKGGEATLFVAQVNSGGAAQISYGDYPLRATPDRRPHRHCRVDPEPAGLIRRRGHHSPVFRPTADQHRLTPKLRIVQLLHRRRAAHQHRVEQLDDWLKNRLPLGIRIIGLVSYERDSAEADGSTDIPVIGHISDD